MDILTILHIKSTVLSISDNGKLGYSNIFEDCRSPAPIVAKKKKDFTKKHHSVLSAREGYW